jgi:hypothetical protein
MRVLAYSIAFSLIWRPSSRLSPRLNSSHGLELIHSRAKSISPAPTFRGCFVQTQPKRLRLVDFSRSMCDARTTRESAEIFLARGEGENFFAQIFAENFTFDRLDPHLSTFHNFDSRSTAKTGTKILAGCGCRLQFSQ